MKFALTTLSICLLSTALNAAESAKRPSGFECGVAAVRVWAIGPDAAATIKSADILAIWRADRGNKAQAAAEADQDFGE